MSRIIVLWALALLALAGALLEGLLEQVPPHYIQVNGILIILCTGAFTLSTLKIRLVDK